MRFRRGVRLACLLGTVFVVGAMIVGALFHNEFRAQNWDPMQTRVYVDRAMRYGGTFYENGLVNKGPVEPFIYRIAAAITSYDGFWYAISVFVLIVSGILGWAVSKTVQCFNATGSRGARMLGIAAGIGVFFHFALGKADYAGVLYARNILVGIYALAWMIGLTRRWWLPGRARWASAAIGILLGLGIQLLFVSTIAAVGVGIAAMSAIGQIEDDDEYRASRRILFYTPIAVFLTAPVYYIVRGRFQEFWSSYWTYNVYQNIATGRSLANQLAYGRDAMLRYYRAWPVSFVIVVVFFAVSAALWRSLSRPERLVHLAVTVWFVGAWTELILGQRYSTHYFSILAVPTALMAATVVGHVYRLIVGIRGEFRTAIAWPLIASMLVIAFGGGTHLTLGLEAASSFTSVHEVAEARTTTEPGPQRTVRAVLDLVSQPGDPLLAWTEYPWTYLQYHRVAATRWIWKSFMLGQVYLGRASPSYVLPKTWDWFDQDMAEAHPAAFLEETALPLTQGNPFATYVDEGFERVYSGGDNNIYLRSDEANDVLRGDRGSSFVPTLPLDKASSWTTKQGIATLPPSTTPSLTDVLRLSDSLCTRISGTYRAAPGTDGSFLSFRFDSADGAAPNMRLNIVDTEIFSGDDGAIFDSTYLDLPATEPATTDPVNNTVADAGTGDASTADPYTGVSDSSADQTALPPNQAGPIVAIDPNLGDSGNADVAPNDGLTTDTSQHEFAIVVGRESAAIVIDGAVRAAVRLTSQNRLSLEVRNGGVTLTDLHRGAAPPDSGCS